jgi:hypothetical protein
MSGTAAKPSCLAAMSPELPCTFAKVLQEGIGAARGVALQEKESLFP